MNYQQSLDYVYHAKELGAKKNGLDNITELLKRLGNPEALFPSVHVAGTNGKGSTCAMLDSILRAAGYRTGLYTSPYLERFTERIRLSGREIAQAEFASLATEVSAAAEGMVSHGLARPTFFELVTACCFLYYGRHKPDIAVIETGLGGLTDATNVLHPLACAITAIGIDHAHVLGGTLESTAREKAGIIKPGVPCVLSAGNDAGVMAIIGETARLNNSILINCSDDAITLKSSNLDGQTFDLRGNGADFTGLRISLLGSYQLRNAATAALTALALRPRFNITRQAVYEGLASARWPGRMEVLRREPLILIDGAHNPQGAEALADCVLPLLHGQKACLVTGVMADKDATPMAGAFARFAGLVIATYPPANRLLHSPEELAELFRAQGIATRTCPDYIQALEQAMESGMPMVVSGSLYLAGAARTWLKDMLEKKG